MVQISFSQLSNLKKRYSLFKSTSSNIELQKERYFYSLIKKKKKVKRIVSPNLNRVIYNPDAPLRFLQL